MARRRPQRPHRPWEREPAPFRIRGGLDYLAAWRELAQIELAGSDTGGPRMRGFTLPPEDAGPGASLEQRFVDAIDRFEHEHPRHPLVHLAARMDVTPLHLALLHECCMDRIHCCDRGLGLSVLGLMRELVTQPAGWSEALRQACSLKPDSPLLKEGLLDVDARAGGRWVDARVTPTDALLELVFGADGSIDVADLKGAGAGPDTPGPFGPEREEEEAPKAAPPTDAPFILAPDVEAQWEEVVGMVEAWAARVEDPQFASVLPRGRALAVLAYGEPGCGKTLGADDLARRTGRALHVFHAPQAYDKWFGSTEKTIARHFEAARKLAAENGRGCVLLIDEADALCVPRAAGGSHHPAYRLITEALMTQIENADPAVLVYMTTNGHDTDWLDPALESRLFARIHFPRPGPAERRRIVDALLPGGAARAPELDLDIVACADVTGREIKQAVLKASLRAGMRAAGVITNDDLAAAIRGVTAGRWTRSDGAEQIGFRRGA